MSTHDLRDRANRQFDKHKTAEAKEKRVTAERHAAAREIQAKTERLRALRLAKEDAEKAAMEAPQLSDGKGNA